MIDTNLFLTLAFSVITNFANVAHIPEANVPQTPADLRIRGFRPHAPPTDCVLIGPNESHYLLQEGVVQYYETQGDNYFSEQNPANRGKYVGTSLLTTDQAVQLSSNVLQRLIRNGTTLGKIPPKVFRPNDYQGQSIPTFRIEWPAIMAGGLPVGAIVEIDGRTAKIVQVMLDDNAYEDPEAAKRMISKVYKPDPARPIPPSGGGPPLPTTNEVSRAIGKWLVFCSKLGLETGSNTNLADIDWKECYSIPALPVLPDSLPCCKVQFKNGATFTARDKTISEFILSSYDDDGSVTQGSGGGVHSVRGRIVHRWEDLAKGVKPVLSAKLGIPEAALRLYQPTASGKPPEVGTEGPRELWVVWGALPNKGFRVQFDLETGKMEGISFEDTTLLKSLRDIESKW